jgi:adenine-specific DNA methylase
MSRSLRLPANDVRRKDRNEVSLHAKDNLSTLVSSISAAAAYASKHFRLPFEESDIKALIRLNLITNFAERGATRVLMRPREIESYGVLVDWSPDDPAIDTLFSRMGGRRGGTLPGKAREGWLIFTVDSSLSFSLRSSDFRSHQIQLFLKEYRRSELDNQLTRSSAVRADPPEVHFRSSSTETVRAAVALWKDIAGRSDEASEDERRVTPSIYGVKTRLLPFVISIIRSVAPVDAIIFDLMSGAGIVTRKLAQTHRVLSNDANDYGRVLAGALTARIRASDIAPLIERLKSRASKNIRALEDLFGSYLTREGELLHTARTHESIEQYAAFCREVPSFFGNLNEEPKSLSSARLNVRQLIAERRKDARAFPFALATSYWANVHFGLRQSVLLDSLRYALEDETEPLRTVLLAALIQAAVICASGPHFAQPFKPRGLEQFKALIDKRSKRVDAEFFAIISRYVALPATRHPIIAATSQNWREALTTFSRSGTKGVIYVDPPYTPMQYSRYYHVLNVLARYDYPECAGPGRCPERNYRFSSRFEFKPGPAKKELADLIRECAAAGHTLVMSYSRSGAIVIADIVALLDQAYEEVDVFQANIRHHAQGKAPPAGRLETIEYMLTAQRPRNAECVYASTVAPLIDRGNRSSPN